MNLATQVRKLWSAFDGLAGDTLWSIAHDGSTLLTALISFSLLQRSLEVSQYGSYVAAYGMLGTLGALSFSGVGLALLQRIIGERDDAQVSLNSFLSLSMLLGAAGGVVAVMFGPRFVELNQLEIFLLVIGELLGAGVIFVLAMGVQASFGFAAATRLKLGVIYIRLVSVVVLFAVGGLSVLTLAASFCFLFLSYALYLMLVHLPKSGYRVDFCRPGRETTDASLMFSVPMGASRLQTDGDKFLLGAFGFLDAAGLYGAAYRVIMIGITPLMALDTAAFQRYLPKVEGQPGVHWRRAKTLGTLTFVASLFVVGGIYLFLPLFEWALLTGDYKEAGSLVPWLLVIIPLIATINAPMNGLLGLGLVRVRMFIYLGSAALSLALYLILIPFYDWRGAAVATIISEVVLSVVAWTVLWKAQQAADKEIKAQGEVIPAIS